MNRNLLLHLSFSGNSSGFSSSPKSQMASLSHISYSGTHKSIPACVQTTVLQGIVVVVSGVVVVVDIGVVVVVVIGVVVVGVVVVVEVTLKKKHFKIYNFY